MSAESYQQQLSRVLGEISFRGAIPDWYRDHCAGTANPAPFPEESRRYARFRFTTTAVLTCVGNLPILPRRSEPYVVLTIDLSRQGLGFLHEEQLFPHERITLWLPDHEREYMVTRCRRHHAQCYEVGAQLVVKPTTGIAVKQ